MAVMMHRYIVGMACMIGVAACTQPAAPVATTSPVVTTNGAVPPETGTAPAPTQTVVHEATGSAAGSRACMIAGEFQLLGRTIRSRDCVQRTGATTEAELKRACEGLAQTSAQMGGKAGQVTYLEACPSPAQGQCTNALGPGFDGYYYERSGEDLAALPGSCRQGGGSWSAG